ncbi:hypothetical protein [Streptomyces showdoensis]|uniref:Uncharacterized protein n=1 Tax=Streptomyces showdoensis TaxID=68268 RepID=A0A2P2GKM9_STREW|nr:hypothetical protein [Streptomyces showdoensis]KKZ72057.1 hypothetical protein VO63_19930 [Streptomyces showdoensis]
MPHSLAEQAEVAARRADLIRLRLRGVPFNDHRILDLGYASPGAASKDLIRALEAHRDDAAAEASVYRQQENERLDALLDAVWRQATTERPVYGKDGQFIGNEVDMRAVDTVLKLMDRRAKLNGLDAPVKTEVSGPGGGAVRLDHVGLAELNRLIATAGDPDTDETDDDEDDDLRYVDEDEDDDRTSA